MRFMTLMLSLVAFTPAAFASQWKLLNEQRMQGNTPDQVRIQFDRDTTNRFDWLRRAHTNAQIVGQNIPAITGMNVVVGTYHWEGLSVCDANDARLTKQIDSGALYFANGQNTSWNMPLEEVDPCRLGVAEPTRQFTGEPF